MKKSYIKFISLLVIISCLIGICPIYSAMANEGLTDEQKALLSVIDVYDESLSLDSTLTKGEFANLLAKGVFSKSEYISAYNPKTALTDVDEYADCYEAVKALHALGYAGVDKFGYFYPDNKITYNEAIAMIHRALGYSDSYVKDRWKTIQNFATSKKISRGLTIADGNELNLYSAYVLIYNMLNCNISEQFDGEYTLYMSYIHDIYEIDGVVTHDGIVSCDGKTNLKPGQIMVGNEVFVNESGIADLFGQNICGWYRAEKDKNVLAAVYNCTQQNEVITLTSSDIVSMKNKIYSYDLGEPNGKIKKAQFNSSSDIFYNGKRVSITDPFTDDMFIPKNGRVRLYNNDGDKTIEIVRIEDYNVGIVGAVDVDKEKIYIDNSRIVDLDGADYLIEDKYGNSLELSDISKDDVVSYCKSFDGKIASVLVSKDSYSDIVSQIESTGIITTESGARYEFSQYAIANNEEVEAGEAYVFYFDVFNKLCCVKKDSSSNDMHYGYIAGIAKEGTFDSNVLMRIFTESGEFKDYYLNKNVKILDGNDKEDYYTQKEIYDSFAYIGIVRYRFNSDRKITYIELPLNAGSVPDREDRLYYILDTRTSPDANETEKDKNKRLGQYQTFSASDYINIGAVALVTPETMVIHCPDVKDDYDNYKIGGISSFAEYGVYEMFVMGTDYRKRMADAVIMFTTFSEKITSEYPYAVKKVVKTYDGNNDCEAYKLDLIMRNGTEYTYFMEAEDYENEVFAIANGVTTPIKLQPGDWIYFTASEDYIIKATCAFDFDHVVEDEQGNNLKGAIAGTQLSYYSADNPLSNPFYVADQGTQNAGDSNKSWQYYTDKITLLTGWVYSYEDGCIQITTQNPAYGVDLNKGLGDGALLQIFTSSRGICAETVGKDKINIRPYTDADIKSYLDYGADCSRIVLAKYKWSPRGCMIIND